MVESVAVGWVGTVGSKGLPSVNVTVASGMSEVVVVLALVVVVVVAGSTGSVQKGTRARSEGIIG